MCFSPLSGITALLGPGAASLKFLDLTHTHAHSVGLLWTRDRTVAETSTWQHTTQQTAMTPAVIRTRNPSKWAAADLRLRLRSLQDRYLTCTERNIKILSVSPHIVMVITVGKEHTCNTQRRQGPERGHLLIINPYPTAFPYENGMVLHFYQQQESSTTKTVHKVINKGLKTYV